MLACGTDLHGGPQRGKMSTHKTIFPLAALLAALPAFAQVDLSGTWADRITEDSYERSGGPPLGDYQGIPLNDAGRMKADSHDHSEWSLPEFQCRPHPGPYQWRALGAVRISQEVDPVSREVAEYHFEYLRSLERPIYMDGRPHPPDYAPHSWSGFSTGKWQGNMLVITTTHLKGAYLRRNGASFSDNATMMEYITRHGDYLVIAMIVTDPVWLEEPFIQTTHYELDPHTQLTLYPCTVSEENISTKRPAFSARAEPESRRRRHSADWGARRRRVDVSRVPKEVERPWARRERGGQDRANFENASVSAQTRAGRPNSRAAGAGQRLYVGGRGRQHHRVDRQGRHLISGRRPGGHGREGDVHDPPACHRHHRVAGAQSLPRPALRPDAGGLDQPLAQLRSSARPRRPSRFVSLSIPASMRITPAGTKGSPSCPPNRRSSALRFLPWA